MTSISPPSSTTSTAVPGTMLPPSASPCLHSGTHTLAILMDRRRELAARIAGLDIEICMELGDRDGARRAMREMNAQTLARQAVRSAGCFFDQAGEIDSRRATCA